MILLKLYQLGDRGNFIFLESTAKLIGVPSSMRRLESVDDSPDYAPSVVLAFASRSSTSKLRHLIWVLQVGGLHHQTALAELPLVDHIRVRDY